MTIDRRAFAALVGLISVIGGCAPKRPSGVPTDAIWVGADDGGAWFKCDVEEESEVNRCSVYFETTGTVWMSGEFVLRDEKRPANRGELIFSGADGRHIYLKNGGVR